ncbi:hypothetical protein SEA_LUCKYSOCKE_143 [Streptomyces phage LuckySocke]|nr:hypothetical protein SEA_LUCKYSOCKE_143 [Streptomyces phage LuckySocke]
MIEKLKEWKEWWDGLDDELEEIHADHRNRQQRRHPGLTIMGGRHSLKVTAQRSGSIKVYSGR